jgi:hypothetical protein
MRLNKFGFYEPIRREHLSIKRLNKNEGNFCAFFRVNRPFQAKWVMAPIEQHIFDTDAGKRQS